MSTSLNELTYSELMFTKIVKAGDRGRDVKLAQEWLSFHGLGTAIDGDFGPATELCVKRFQSKAGFNESGIVDKATQSALLAPIAAASASIAAGSKALGALVVAYARQHLKSCESPLPGATFHSLFCFLAAARSENDVRAHLAQPAHSGKADSAPWADVITLSKGLGLETHLEEIDEVLSLSRSLHGPRRSSCNRHSESGSL